MNAKMIAATVALLSVLAPAAQAYEMCLSKAGQVEALRGAGADRIGEVPAPAVEALKSVFVEFGLPHEEADREASVSAVLGVNEASPLGIVLFFDDEGCRTLVLKGPMPDILARIAAAAQPSI